MNGFKPLAQTKRLLLIAILLTLGMGALYSIMYFHIHTLAGNRAEALAKIRALEDEQASGGKFRQEQQQFIDTMNTIDPYFLSADNIVPLLETIESYARSSGVALEFDSAALSSDGAHIDIDMTAGGSFSSVYRFLTLVEAAPFELGIKSATLSTTSVTDTSNAKKPITRSGWSAHVSLSVYSVDPAKKPLEKSTQ
jgi:hypothetical protein